MLSRTSSTSARKRRWRSVRGYFIKAPSSYRSHGVAAIPSRTHGHAFRPGRDRRRGIGPNGRQRAVPAFDLHQGVLPTAALGQAGGAAIEGEHVGVAVYAEAARLGRVQRVVPGTGREVHHTGTKVLAQDDPGEATTTLVEDSHHVAICNASGESVSGMETHWLAAPHFRRLAFLSGVILAVETRARVVGDQLERVRPALGAAQPFLRLVPGGVADAVLVAEAVDRLREELDAPARGVQRRRFRIPAKRLECDQVL